MHHAVIWILRLKDSLYLIFMHGEVMRIPQQKAFVRDRVHVLLGLGDDIIRGVNVDIN